MDRNDRYVTRQTVTARQFESEESLGLFAETGGAKVGDWLVRQNLDTFTVVHADQFAEDFEPEGEWLPVFPELQADAQTGSEAGR